MFILNRFDYPRKADYFTISARDAAVLERAGRAGPPVGGTVPSSLSHVSGARVSADRPFAILRSSCSVPTTAREETARIARRLDFRGISLAARDSLNPRKNSRRPFRDSGAARFQDRPDRAEWKRFAFLPAESGLRLGPVRARPAPGAAGRSKPLRRLLSVRGGWECHSRS